MLYPSAKVIIVSPQHPDKILLIQRNGFYEPVGGKLEVNFMTKQSELLEVCALREAREELGVDIEIKNYIGNYYFFWSIDPKKFSSCVVFMGTLLRQDPAFVRNSDTCEFEVQPAWVLKRDILTGKIPIDPMFIGLQELLIKCCKH